ncbi:MAG: Oxygen-dependent coproporphyrinogen-III oxidase [Chlamydiae bacterium]|nr:Oxygen-dependent coproporphyrinogen-III oxidase [Chlamydiota bacterium]
MKKPDQSAIVDYLKKLQLKIISSFESIEPKEKFIFKSWPYNKGDGGGKMAHLRGSHFEKAAVNFSAVAGPGLPFNESSGSFFATGVSLITHMMNPHAPTVHMNVRYIETEDKFWFGGGYDLTPMGPYYEEDKKLFHNVSKTVLNAFDTNLYPLFSKNAQEYFFIPHRKKERGVGGIFFDHYNSGNLELDLELWKAIGSSFTDAIMPIYDRRINTPYTEEEKEQQNQLRAHYVEFNLLYDRGTKFGFQSNGNPEAILSSMPPIAKW